MALRYISISHKKASVKQREKFYIPDTEKDELIAQLCMAFPDISGLLLLVTCNRTEVYFEAESTTASSVLRFLIDHRLDEKPSIYEQLFISNDATEKSVAHLLEVSSGLVSKVLGDAEIICQIKKAYQTAIQHNLQGSLLERAMQTVFKSHKRIRNETHFRDGTTSVAYKALKMIADSYGREAAKEKKILFIGAGDIVRQLFKYNLKFGFEQVYISNRTKSKAIALVKRYDLGQWFEWNKVLTNNFEGIDIIISAAGNCPLLIKEIKGSPQERLLIDLSLPGNIDPSLSLKKEVLFYDLDAISAELEENKEKRWGAVAEVRLIKKEELEEFMNWYRQAPLRAMLAEFKIQLSNQIKGYLKKQKEPFDSAKTKLITNRVMRKLAKHEDPLRLTKKIEALIEQHAHIK